MRDSIYAIAHICYRLYAIACPFVRPSVRRVDHRKTVEVRIMKFSPYGSPIPIVFVGKFHPKILRGSPSGGLKERWGGKIQRLSSFKREYLENGSRYG